MPISIESAVELIGKLRCLNYFKDDTEWIQARVEALRAASVSQAHARAVVEGIIESFSDVPAPAEIRRAAARLRPQRKNYNTGCRLCRGRGLVRVNDEGQGTMKRCECVEGA
jgi:hypothetical protein